MPLQNGIQLIMQVQEPGGGFRCEAYSGLPITNPVLLVFAHARSAAAEFATLRLTAKLRSELEAAGGWRALHAPCGGTGQVRTCHAVDQAECRKLLVLVGDADLPLDPVALPMLSLWLDGDDSFSIVPVLPYGARSRTMSLVPAGVDKRNAAFWTDDIGETIPAIYATAGITPAQPRIFISYRQTDTADLALQLFDALSHAGFDAFLDHFRIPPGVNFQSRLFEELGDKSMVLLLESKRLLESPWVRYEIAAAKQHSLGLFALTLPGAPRAPEVDEDLRLRLAPASFRYGLLGFRGRLTRSALAATVGIVRAQHDRASLRRRRRLEMSFVEAFRNAGAPPPVREPNGAFRVETHSKDYLTWLTTRPPDLPDFHYLHGAAHKPVVGVIIGLSSLMEPPRARRSEWLAQLCDLRLIDEGRLAWAAGEMAGGRL